MDHVPARQARISILAGALPRLPALADAFVARFEVEPTQAGPLSGTTFAVKDVFDVAGWPTGCGNPTWRASHSPAPAHAAAAQRLLDDGARLKGKTLTDELAYSLDGRNHHEGAPRNPAAPARLTGGSSSGSAAAVASGDVDFALGTDTAGSVRVPAAWCGILGVRPTHGRVAVAGLTPLAPSFDTVGWFARSGSLLRSVGRTLLDPEPSARDVQSRVTSVRDAALDALVEADATAQSASQRAAAARLAERLPVMRPVHLGIDLREASECLRILQAREAWDTHGAWIEAHRPRFGPGIAERFRAARDVTDAEVREATAARAALVVRVNARLPAGTILMLPAVPGPAPLRGAPSAELHARRARLLALTVLASLCGRPQLCLPLRESDGAPVGIALLGWRGGDEVLLEIAAQVFP